MTQLRRVSGVNRVGGVVGRFGPNGESGVWPMHALASDPYYDDVSLLLHMNGTDGSTTFTDSSKNAFSMTANGNAQISTTQSQFSGASGLFDGNGDWVEASANTAFSFSTSDWTAECWFYIQGNALQNAGGNRDACLFALAVQPNVSFSVVVLGSSTTTGTGFQYFQNTPATVNIQRTVTVSQQVWHHVAVVRRANSVSIFFNGSLQGASASVTAASGDSTRPFSVGRLGNTTGYIDYFNGHIDELRITKGRARYQSAFVVPSRAFLP